jgi:hypothetical protein
MKSGGDYQMSPFEGVLELYMENLEVFGIFFIYKSRAYCYVLAGVAIGAYLALEYDAITVILFGLVVLVVIFFVMSISLTSVRNALTREYHHLEGKEFIIKILVSRVSAVVQYTLIMAMITGALTSDMHLISKLLIVFIICAFIDVCDTMTRTKREELHLEFRDQ